MIQYQLDYLKTRGLSLSLSNPQENQYLVKAVNSYSLKSNKPLESYGNSAHQALLNLLLEFQEELGPI